MVTVYDAIKATIDRSADKQEKAAEMVAFMAERLAARGILTAAEIDQNRGDRMKFTAAISP